MRNLVLLAFSFVALSACNSSDNSSETPSRQVAAPSTIVINQDWQFQKSAQLATEFTASKQWQEVDLPHTPKVEPLLVNDQWQGIAVYQKTLDLSQFNAQQQVFIKFEGAMKVAEVWLDEVYLGKHVGGYLPFSFDISPYIGKKQATIKVRLDNHDNWVTGPKPLHLLDFNTYGGLYRDVKLVVKNKLHITNPVFAAKVASGGLFITSENVSAGSADVVVKTHLKNASDTEQQFEVQQILSFEGKEITRSTQKFALAAGKDQQFSQQLAVNTPNLWHPNHPHLYELQTLVKQGDAVVDQQSNRVGIRSFAFNDKHQLLINGEVTFLRGVNRHQEYPHVGYATSPEADYRDAQKIKSAGFDYVRLSHYPHSKAFMDAADELGLVLVDAILGWQYYSPFPEFQQHIFQTCHDLIRRDRNHASVLAWECSLNESWMPEDFIAALDNIVDSEFPGAYSAGWQPEYDIYLQARQHRLQHYDTPTQPYNVSEYGDWEYYAQNAGLNQDAWGNLKAEERTSRQLLNSGEKRLLQQATNIQEAHNDNLTTPAYSDGYWVMFDYNRGYADDLEASGIASIYRLPKYSYYFYQSQRSPEIVSDKYASGPMVFIASDWTKDSNTTVRVFSNTERVELWLNGEKIQSKTPVRDKLSSHIAHPPINFEINRFEAGELLAKAYIGDKLVAQHQVVTPKESSQLQLLVDESGTPVTSDDVVFVHAQLLDENGNPSLENDVEVEFSLQGDITLINPEAISTRRGFASAVIKTGKNFKGATISATAKNKTIKTSTFTF